MTTKLPVWVLYVLAEIALLGTWAVTLLTPASADFGSLVSTSALKALVVIELVWIMGCAAHARTTGDWTPVEPAAAADHAEHTARLARIEGVLREIPETIVADVERLFRHHVTPAPLPAPPAPPVVPSEAADDSVVTYGELKAMESRILAAVAPPPAPVVAG